MSSAKIKRGFIWVWSIVIFASSFFMSKYEVRATESGGTGEEILAGEPQLDEALNEVPIEYNNEIEVVEQKPERIENFSERQSMENIEYRAGKEIDIGNDTTINTPLAHQVFAGIATDYLLQAGDVKTLSLSLNPGVYLQARLTQPNNPEIDYDLYLLDNVGNILSGSDTYTHINGTTGTLQESLGYIIAGSDAATYHLAVMSTAGGSADELFTLEYTLSDTYDQFEIDENPRQALPLAIGSDGIILDVRSISSPLDNDWYIIDIPENRIYDYISMSVLSQSSNTCGIEIYRNTITNGYKMERIIASDRGMAIALQTGTYYVRIYNNKPMANFNDQDVQNYKLKMIPTLKPEKIVISEYDGNEGVNHYVKYPGFTRGYFRTKSWISVKGTVIATDKDTGTIYGISDYSVTAKYRNPYWEANHTPGKAKVVGTGISDSIGDFYIEMKLPDALGGEWYSNGISTQSYDLCYFDTYLTENENIKYEDIIIHYNMSSYN